VLAFGLCSHCEGRGDSVFLDGTCEQHRAIGSGVGWSAAVWFGGDRNRLLCSIRDLWNRHLPCGPTIERIPVVGGKPSFWALVHTVGWRGIRGVVFPAAHLGDDSGNGGHVSPWSVFLPDALHFDSAGAFPSGGAESLAMYAVVAARRAKLKDRAVLGFIQNAKNNLSGWPVEWFSLRAKLNASPPRPKWN